MKIILTILSLLLTLYSIINDAAANLDNSTVSDINHDYLKIIESSMDLTAKPCDDFYQYACGNWEKNHAKTKTYNQNYDMIDYYTNKGMAIVFHNLLNIKDQPKFVRNAFAYYKSCITTKRYNIMGYMEALAKQEYLRLIYLPTTERYALNFDWIKSLAAMRKYGLTGIIIEETVYQLKNYQKIELHKPSGKKGFQKLSYQDLQAINMISLNLNKFSLQSLWRNISTFENLLKKYQTLKPDSERRKSFTLRTLSALPTWSRLYIKLVLQQMNLLEPQVKIVAKDMLYMNHILRLSKQFDEKFLCGYLEVRFLWYLYKHVPWKFTPDMCALQVRTFMNLAMDWLYESKKRSLPKEMSHMHQMFNNISNKFRKMLKSNSNAFNKTITKYLLHKLDKIQLKLGQLPRNNTRQLLETIYGSLELSEQDLYGNQLQLLKFHANYTRISHTDSENPHEFYDIKKEYAPYFRRTINMVIIPIHLLQFPIYHHDLSDIFKYSSLGYIMGHELSHAFDYDGVRYEFIPNGYSFNQHSDAITNNSKFNENLECLHNLNEITINEKIADVTGFRLAYETYFELNPNGRKESAKINGQDLSLDKIFFLSHAQFRCSTASLNVRQSAHSHGSPHDRLIDSYSHFPEFVKTFGCSKSDRMTLKKTCQLWRK